MYLDFEWVLVQFILKAISENHDVSVLILEESSCDINHFDEN